MLTNHPANSDQTVFSVLHADSDPFMRTIIRNVFANAMFKLDSASNGKEAFVLMEAKNYQYDVVITDMYMPYANGYEIINKVMKESPQTKTIITSNMSYLHIREQLDIVRENCFKKPLVVGKLAERVRLILSQESDTCTDSAPIALESNDSKPVLLSDAETSDPMLSLELTETAQQRQEMVDAVKEKNEPITLVAQEPELSDIGISELVAREEIPFEWFTPSIVKATLAPQVKETALSGKRWW